MFRLSASLLRTAQRKCRSNLLKEKSTKATSINQQSQEVGDRTKQDATPVESSEQATGVEMSPDASTKLQARGPLAKNFFVGIVDKELLAYPEVVAREEMLKLQNEVLPLKNFFEEQVEHAIEVTHTIAPSVLDNMKQLGLYGLNVPSDYEGKGYGWSESLIATQPETECTSLALGLLSHRTVVDFLKEMGTVEQQQRYFSKLASGDLVGTEAIYEYNAPEDDFFNTRAVFENETGSWLLDGEKAFVVSGPLASGTKHLLLVLAQTQKYNTHDESSGRGTTIFLVESDKPGVKFGDQHLTFGCRGAQMRRVKFEQVRLPNDCVVGEAHDGNRYSEHLLRAGRLRYSLLGFTLAKNLLNDLTQYSIETQQCGTQLKDMEMVRSHLSRAMCSTYAIESMIYLTAGLLDEFAGQDVTLEAAMTKYFTLKKLFEMASVNMNVIGPKCLHAGQATELSFRNAAQLYTQGESVDTLNMFIALTGLQHAGVSMNDVVRKARNPLFHPGHIFSKFLETSSIDQPNTKMRLGDNLHPSLEPAAQFIEHSVARLQMSVELMFTRHGNAVVERHIEMQRLAEISTTIYAMFASVARASRSYCIGLPLADHELLTATAIATNGRDVVKTLCTDLFNGHFVNNDNNLTRLASQVTKSKGYFAVHPLTFNF